MALMRPFIPPAHRHFWSGTIADQMQWTEYEAQPGDVAGSKREISELMLWMSRQVRDLCQYSGTHGARFHLRHEQVFLRRVSVTRAGTRLQHRFLTGATEIKNIGLTG